MVEEKYINSFDGTRLFYKVHQGKGPWVVMLHSPGSNNTTLWYEIEEFKKKGYSIIAPDLRTHGKSGWGNTHFESFVKDLDVIIRVEKCGQVELLGACATCSLAVAYGDRYPEKVKQLYLIYPVYIKYFSLQGMFWHYAGHVLQFFIQSRKRKRKKSLDFKHIPITGVIPFLLNIRLGMNLKDYLSSLNSMIHYPLTPEKIKRPTNVIMAQRDFLMKNK
ncbi:MAG: alpha/beta hydrolase, partial [Candidatus Woesearchaeota archaeon]|nr:alpha/beta hydrolase [Candidatus Woesearchaeota archaeon]